MANHSGSGTKADPWVLKTPPGTSEYQMYLDDAGDPPAIICQVGGTQLKYDRRAIDDLHAMLKAHGDWMPLGGADEQKPAPDGSVEAWGRSAGQPGRWLVRPQEGPARPVRRLHAAAARGARAGRGHPRRQEQQDAGDLRPGGDPIARHARRRPVRRARRPQPAGDRRAAGARRADPSASSPTRCRSAGRRSRATSGCSRRPGWWSRSRAGRGAIYRLHDEGVDGRPRLSRAGLGRGDRRGSGSSPRTRRPRAVIEPIRLAFDVACPADHAFEVWTARIGAVVAGRPHRLGRGRPDGRPRAAPGWPDLRADARRRRARLGRGHGLGAAQPARLPVAPPPRPGRRDGGRDPVPRARRRDDAGRDRASRLGAPRRRGRGVARPEPWRLGDACCRTTSRRRPRR